MVSKATGVMRSGASLATHEHVKKEVLRYVGALRNQVEAHQRSQDEGAGRLQKELRAIRKEVALLRKDLDDNVRAEIDARLRLSDRVHHLTLPWYRRLLIRLLGEG